ncbi:MAG: YicC/YloC family endoribonuclease [Pseudomonadota bacterium]
MFSMTGFGRGAFCHGKRSYRLEVRALNNRFLDVKVRIPWTDAEMESRVVQKVRSRINRGRVEVSVWDDKTTESGSSLKLDKVLAEDLCRVLDEITATVKCDRQTAAVLLANARDLVGSSSVVSSDSEELWRVLEKGLESALDELLAMRCREGESLKKDLEKNLTDLADLVRQITFLTRGEPEKKRALLTERVQSLLGEIELDPSRLMQEVALLADRLDVGEELVRLDSHFAQTKDMLRKDEPVGRKLEFMLQELNRELNTIASKTTNAEVSRLVVGCKSHLERMREQAQNAE